MKPSDVILLFSMYHQLLGVYEPHEAILWLISEQPALGNRCPCDLIQPRKYEDVLTLINKLRREGGLKGHNGET